MRRENRSADATLVVFSFPGGGSVDDNFTRWCQQFSQPDGRPSTEVATRALEERDGARLVLGRPSAEQPRRAQVGAAQHLAALTPAAKERRRLRVVCSGPVGAREDPAEVRAARKRARVAGLLVQRLRLLLARRHALTLIMGHAEVVAA